MTGLAATLKDEGFTARAIKPIHLGLKSSAWPELNFISTISKTALDYDVQYIETPGALPALGWSQAIKVCRSGTELVLAELPASCATPLCKLKELPARCTDARDFANELDWPCLLVAKAGVDTLEKLVLNAAYLSSQCRVIGMVIVETEANPPRDSWVTSARESIEIGLAERTGLPFLGCLRYSPSISVPKINQGNLIKTTSAALDLLPIIKALNLRLAV